MRNIFSLNKYSIIIFINILLLTMSYITPGLSLENFNLPPKVIYGTAIGKNGENVDGAFVVVTAEDYPDENTTVREGAWSVDIGLDTGIEWPDGTFFTVSINKNDWNGSYKGFVKGKYTDVGEIIINNIESEGMFDTIIFKIIKKISNHNHILYEIVHNRFKNLLI